MVEDEKRRKKERDRTEAKETEWYDKARAKKQKRIRTEATRATSPLQHGQIRRGSVEISMSGTKAVSDGVGRPGGFAAPQPGV